MTTFRRFIQLLDERDELQYISEIVDWKYEVGAITRQNQRAVLFKRIKDYPGFSILTNALGSYSRISLALGLDYYKSYKDLARVFRQRVKEPIPPIIVEQDSAFRMVKEGNDIDLHDLPIPWWNHKDRGRYIGTWHLNITKDPVSGFRNVGVYRMQVLGPRETTVSVSPKSHIAVNLQNAKRLGNSLEMAVALGVDEVLVMAAAASMPYGVDEFTIAGGLARRPIKLKRCETVNLEVPADSEILLEGLIHPSRRVTDGPFFDYAGMPNTNRSAYSFEVLRMSFMEKPIFRGTAVGYYRAEDQLLSSLLASAGVLDFHSSQIRQTIQNTLLRWRLFRAYQLSGKISQLLKGPGG